MSFKRIFIPEAEQENTIKGRAGEVCYWIGCVFGIVAVYFGILGDTEAFGTCLFIFFDAFIAA